MYGILEQMALLVAMTHGLRALGRLAGPRRCGLVLGLPSSTALMLLYCGREYGVGEAMAAAESSLLSLVAAAALPLSYARAIGADARLLLAPTSAIAGYVAVASVSRILPDAGAVARVGFSIVGILAACGLARRVRVAGGEPRPGARPWYRTLALETMVSVVLIVMVRMVRVVGGATWARLFTTFPAMSLAVLVTTHLETGPAAACRMARAMPPGNLIMIVYLVAFRLAGPRIGLGWGTACGYAVALATLLLLERLVRSVATEASPPGRPARRIVAALGNLALLADAAPARFTRRPVCPRSIRRRSPRHMRRFAPRVESLPG